MPENAPELADRIRTLTQPGFRDRLIAKGLARGLIWRDGALPPDAPQFGADLTTNLLDHGFLLLSLSLHLRDLGEQPDAVNGGLYAAAESLESAARHESAAEAHRGFCLVMAAAAFHIGGFAARAFSLFAGDLSRLNLASYERCLVHLMRRELVAMRNVVRTWMNDPANSDDGVAERLDTDDAYDVDDFLATALNRAFLRALALFEMGLVTGREQYLTLAADALRTGQADAGQVNHVPLWWSFTVARHLCDDLWGNSLHTRLPRTGGPEKWAVLRDRFIEMLASRPQACVDLWPSQLEAAKRVVDPTDDLVVALPTSAGKTRIAEMCILRTLADDKRAVYVTPLRALSAQIEQGLAETFRPLGFSVTSVYGASGLAATDLLTLASASIVVVTPEKLDYAIRQDPSVVDDVGLIVLDEGHMIGLSERELRYEMLVQRLLRRPDASQRRLVCLSAVFTEGDAFDDFTNWLRADAAGTPIRSMWRPTRQRPGRLLWTGRAGRLEFDVDTERPFVPRFVEPRAPTGRRTKLFPSDDQEFVVAAARAFLDRDHSVLVYCPQRRSVEATANAFLKACAAGFFPSQLPPSERRRIAGAVRIGREWLGDDHPAVACLKIGVAVHHGALPRQFLGEIESLLRSRCLRVCVCSPTLAQGVDLNFSVLLFRSIYRLKDRTIDAKEFANVVGRVGRAFVDLDGLYVYPLFNTDSRKVRRRLNDFAHLTRQAQQRQLESGVLLLVRYIVKLLRSRLNCTADQLKEYVLNTDSAWQIPEDDKMYGWLVAALNELDSAILGIVDVLGLSTESLANYLDECLRNSYWQRRLQRSSPEARELQEHLIRGRATWLWARTTERKRTAFFAAGIGHAAGEQIAGQLPAIAEHMFGAESGLEDGDHGAAATHAVALATILYQIYPFVPESRVEGWEELLGHWLRGTPLGQCADNDGVSFIQQDVVYRLVWAVEAARLHLQCLADAGENPPGEVLAQCLTYGVPHRTGAVFMQGGLRSRTMATALLTKLTRQVPDMESLREWIHDLRAGNVDAVTWDGPAQDAEWRHFLSRFDHRDLRQYREVAVELPVEWDADVPPKDRLRVRVVRDGTGQEAMVYSPSFVRLGTTAIPNDVRIDYFTGLVAEDGRGVRARFYGA